MTNVEPNLSLSCFQPDYPESSFFRVPGNVNLINETSDHYADYKTEKITKRQYPIL